MSDPVLRRAELEHDASTLELIVEELEHDALESPDDATISASRDHARARLDSILAELASLSAGPPPKLPAAPLATLGMRPDSHSAAGLSRGLTRPSSHIASQRPLSRALGPTTTTTPQVTSALEDGASD